MLGFGFFLFLLVFSFSAVVTGLKTGVSLLLSFFLSFLFFSLLFFSFGLLPTSCEVPNVPLVVE